LLHASIEEITATFFYNQQANGGCSNQHYRSAAAGMHIGITSDPNTAYTIAL
jgi:hypothetical protein